VTRYTKPESPNESKLANGCEMQLISQTAKFHSDLKANNLVRQKHNSNQCQQTNSRHAADDIRQEIADWALNLPFGRHTNARNKGPGNVKVSMMPNVTVGKARSDLGLQLLKSPPLRER